MEINPNRFSVGGLGTWLLRSRLAFVLISLLGAIAHGGTGSQVRVLFIGNSFTFYNNMPEVLKTLGASRAEGPRFEVQMVVAPGATLQQLWDGGEARSTIKSSKWDFVVLQEQTSLGSVFLVNGIPRITSVEGFHQAVRQFVPEIKQSGAKAVLMLTPSYRDAPEEQGALNYAYFEIAREVGASVAPVGIAYQRARAGSQGDLWWWDGIHPSNRGSYLTACVLYASVTNESPIGLTAKVAAPTVSVDGTGIPKYGETVDVVNLDANESKLYQRTVWDLYRELQEAKGYLSFPKPGPPVLPQLPPGRPIEAARLGGTWLGELRLFVFPQEMSLELREEQILKGQLTLKLKLDHPGPPPRSAALADLELAENELHFSDDDPVGGHVKFRGVLTEAGLVGIAEAFDKDQKVRAVGSWSLKKR
jgi:hypothetical protein